MSLRFDHVYTENGIDIDKLLALVKASPELYDTTCKDYQNQAAAAYAWNTISEQLQVSSADCKHKWHTLRSSYGRYIKTLKNGSVSRKRKWHLADSMSFLHPFLWNRKTSINECEDENNLSCVKNGFQVKNEDFNEYFGALRANTSSRISSSSIKRKRRKKSRNVEEIVAEPTEEYFKLITDLSTKDHPILLQVESNRSFNNLAEGINLDKVKTENAEEILAEPNVEYYESITDKGSNDDPFLLYFKGLMPDIKKLSDTSQRRFKTDILAFLNYYLDMEETINKVPQIND